MHASLCRQTIFHTHSQKNAVFCVIPEKGGFVRTQKFAFFCLPTNYKYQDAIIFKIRIQQEALIFIVSAKESGIILRLHR
jgi:hypothetical protein